MEEKEKLMGEDTAAIKHGDHCFLGNTEAQEGAQCLFRSGAPMRAAS